MFRREWGGPGRAPGQGKEERKSAGENSGKRIERILSVWIESLRGTSRLQEVIFQLWRTIGWFPMIFSDRHTEC